MNNKAKNIYRTIMLIVVVALITFVLTSIFMYKKIGTTTSINIPGISTDLINKLYTVRKIIDNEYVSEIEEENLVEGAVKGYVEGLGDEYTEYFTKSEMEEFKSEVQGNYVGVGIYMMQNTKENNIVILYPIEGSPAEKAGLKSGDIIKKVDDTEFTGEDFEKVSTYIKGKEGTKVKIEIERNGENLTFEVERKKIDLYPIKSEILQNNIGYIKVSSFDDDCAKEFKQTYNELNKSNKLKGLIIDLRNNGGGIVDEALDMADLILDKDKIELISTNKNGEEEIKKSKSNPVINVPIVVLVNGNTASASEIFAAALKENGKATIIGEKTYGKGVIQELISLRDGSGIKVTIEEYLTPNRNKINKVGITPDKEVTLPDTVTSIYNIEKTEDTQLQEAIKLFK